MDLNLEGPWGDGPQCALVEREDGEVAATRQAGK